MQAHLLALVIAATCLGAALLLVRRERFEAQARRVVDPLSDLTTRFVLLPQNWFSARSERGQSMVEYAVVLAVVSMLAIVTMKNVGSNLRPVFTKVASKLHS